MKLQQQPSLDPESPNVPVWMPSQFKDESELSGWSDRFLSVTARSYMRGYRDIYKNVGAFHKLMIRFCDGLVKMKIIRIVFRGVSK